MKAYFLKPVFHILILCSLLAAFFGAPAAAWAASDGEQTIRPLMTINAWNALGSGISGLTGSGSVRAIAINGTNLYIGGTFVDAAGDANADRIAVWDGTSWSALGSGVGNGQVNSLAFHGSNLYVGGTFTDAGGNTAADYIAVWDGSNWSTLGDGLNSTVNAIAVSGSNIYVAGNFTNAGVDPNADYIAKMDGGTWAALGANPLNNAISALAVAGATVYAGGAFTDFAAGGNTNLSRIATWDGSTWNALGSGLNNSVFALTLVGSDLYVGGAFTNAGGNTSADLIAKWDGSAWSALGSGLPSVSVNAIVASGSNLYVGGNFTDAGGDGNADYIARWNGSAWSALGATALNNTVSALLINGLDLYAGGAFIDAGGNFNADRIAQFQIDGTAPTVDSFTATSPSTSLNIPITAFTASDNIGVTGYKITESDTPPATGDTGWTVSPPNTYTVSSSGDYTLYPWARDASGNISTVYGSPASVSVSCPATITVTSSADSGAGTLRQAITDLCADNGTINFDSSLSGGTIRLNSTLILSKNLIIDGSALASQITISGDSDNNGSGNVRVFMVENNANVTLDSLIVTKGAEGSGSGIYINGSGNNLTITNSTFSGNTATTNGGGIYNDSGTLTIMNSTFSGNSATAGGGILNNGSLTITNSTFSGNTASNNGGGINNIAAVAVAVTNSTFSGNTATTNGGGIYTNGMMLTITNSTFSSNSASSRGGGIYNSNFPLTVTSSTFSGNTATINGGGIYNSNAALTVTNSTFLGNTASNNGGGIFHTNGTLTSINSTFSANTANNIGGGIYVNSGSSTLNYANTLIANSTAGGDCVNAGTLGTNTNNLVENGSCSASLSGDPRLGALANNGGPTQTLAPDIGSPVLDAGDDTICAASPVSNLDQRGVTRPVGAHCDIGAYEGAIDIGAPTVTAFTASSPVTSLDIPITAFTASDNDTVSAYLITESPTPPSAGAAGWAASAPTTYAVASSGSYTLYPWAKDAVGNVSNVYGSPASVSVDNAAPTVTAFSVPSASSSLDIPITTFSASDNIAVTDYLITESSSQPSAGAAGWTASAPTTYTVASSGSYTLYPWAKDTLGNVSAVYGSPASVSVDNVAPNVISIERASTNPTSAASVDFIVTFSESVTGADTGDFSLVMSGVSGASVSSVTGSGTIRTISVNTGSDDGSIRLDLLNNNSIQDSVGNSLSGSFTSGESYTLDKTAPTLTAFSVPSTSTSLNISITTFTASDNGTVSAYLITESSSQPSAGDAGWTASAPTTYTVASSGSYTLYPWTKDAVGNISAVYGSPASVSVDTSAPSVTAFNVPSTSASLNIPITTFTASDNMGVTDYLITESSLPPTAGNAGWTASAPTTYPVSSEGSYTLYPWVKDAAGNVSAIYGSPASVTVDTSTPAVTAFSVPFNVTSLNIPITSFTASDNMTVTGYKITTSSVPPSAGAAGWTVFAPTTYTVASDGFYVLYPWVKDAAGNVSSVYGSPAAVSVDATAPTVSSINLVTASPSAKASVQFLVTFSEAVTGVTTTDFSLTTTGSITGSSITSISAGTATYTVTVNTGSGDGTLRLNIPNTATITDLNGNGLPGLPYLSGQIYTINKTLIYTSTASRDGWILESNETSNLGGTLNAPATTFRLGDDVTKKQYRGIMSFNTSGIPDNATITGVTLKIKKQGVTGGGNPVTVFQGFMLDIKTGFFGTSPGLQISDFQATTSKTLGPISTALIGGFYNLNLLNGKTSINKLVTNGGLTQIRLRFKLDDNNNAIANYLSIYSGNAPAASRPQLIVTYTTP